MSAARAALCLALAAGQGAEGDVFHKCVAPDGGVTYADAPCAPGARSERIEIERTGSALPPLPDPSAPDAFLRQQPGLTVPAAPTVPASPPVAGHTPAPRALASRCGEARADANWYAMQDPASFDPGARRELAREEAERQRYIEEYCR